MSDQKRQREEPPPRTVGEVEDFLRGVFSAPGEADSIIQAARNSEIDGEVSWNQMSDGPSLTLPTEKERPDC